MSSLAFAKDAASAVESLQNQEVAGLVVFLVEDSEGGVPKFVQSVADSAALGNILTSYTLLLLVKGSEDLAHFSEVYDVGDTYPSWFLINQEGNIVANDLNCESVQTLLLATLKHVGKPIQEVVTPKVPATSGDDNATDSRKVSDADKEADCVTFTADSWVKHVSELDSTGSNRSATTNKQNSASKSSSLAIRLLDGMKLVGMFEANSTLQDVVDYIDANRTDGTGKYSISARYPTRQFTRQDLVRTMSQLQLCPSGTLFLKNPQGSDDTAFGSGESNKQSASIVSILVGFFASFWAFIVNLFCRQPPGRSLQPVGYVEMRTSQQQGNLRHRNSRGGVQGLSDVIRKNDSDDERNEYFGGDSTVFQGRDDSHDHSE